MRQDSAQNQRSERRIRNNRIRRRREQRKNFLLLTFALCLIVTCSVAVSSFRTDAKSANADAEQEVCKYYRSIVIAEQDTLWSIAEENRDAVHYDSVSAYVDEIKQINTLAGDDIYAGAHLIVPYYGAAQR